MSMDITGLQTKLQAAGYSPGTIDGDLGPNTYTAMLNYVSSKNTGSVGVALGRAMAVDFTKYNVNTPLRIAHFIAQAAHETQYFEFLTEYGGPSYFAQYDGRTDLGNTQPGDGYKYRGRGLFQITGRYNYVTDGTKLSLDLVDNPDLAATPEVATLTACLFWTIRGINALADADNVLAVTHKINGGTNGLQNREDLTTRMKAVLL